METLKSGVVGQQTRRAPDPVKYGAGIMSVSGVADSEQYFVLHDVQWDDYEALSDRFSQRGVRLAYDRGTLEMMTPSFNHEFYSRLICRFVQILTMELQIPIVSGGSTTFRREDLQRGLEPDECYYLAHANDVRGKSQIDLQIDPPPDLAVEVDITSSSLDRQGIYAALLVPEIWRFNTRELQVFVLDEFGAYQTSETSCAFPFLPVKRFEEFLTTGGDVDETEQALKFAEWVRSEIVPSME